MDKNKKLAAVIVSTALIALLVVIPALAAYPASVEEGIAAPAEGEILTGALVGLEEGWGGSAAVGRDAAFDGDITTFFDPLGVGDGYCGIELSEPRELIEIRIHPRSGFLDRFNGAAIYGFNEGYNPDETSPPKGAVLVWESLEDAEALEFQTIKAADFKADAKGKAFKYYVYYNDYRHGDVVEVEFWAKAAAAPAPVEEPAAPEPVEETPAVEAAPEPAPAPAAVTEAPPTGDSTVIFVIALVLGFAGMGLTIRRSAKNV